MLDIFIEGELIDLAIPTEEFAEGKIWYKWFNDREINKYLDQGVFPNTRSLQLEFFRSMGQDRLALIIQNKEGIPFGIVSLSFIDFKKSSCDFAIAIDKGRRSELEVFGDSALEAVALIVEHGFNFLGIRRISSGHHVDLRNFQKKLELIGFRLEGYHKNKFVKGSFVADSVSMAVLYDDFSDICKRRGGRLWDSNDNMKKRMKRMPKESAREKIENLFFRDFLSYYDEVKRL